MKIKVLLSTMLLIFITQTARGSIDVNLPNLGEPVDSSIRNSDVWGSFTRGNYNYALSLTTDEIYQAARDYFLNEKNLPSILKFVAKNLEKILNDSSKTDEQKADEITEIIMASIEPYKYSKANSLNLSLQHSIEHGATLISWDNKTVKFTCSDWYWEYTSELDGDGYNTWVYRKYYITKQPSYKIYRVKNGVEELVSTIDGFTDARLRSFSLSSSFGWGDLLKQAQKIATFKELGINEGRGFFLDLHSDVRESGQTLSYRVQADTSKYGKCGSAYSWNANIDADSDGDGKMDFIPNHEYSKFFGKYYGWLIPVITLNLF